MTPLETLEQSPALWNPSRLDLRSDEVLAQLLDRGTLDDWRARYALAEADVVLRGRIARLAATVPMYLPDLCLAAKRSLGEPGQAVAAPTGADVLPL